uniref:Major sperm protein n=1 Tax=Acrobeloides nanus TaxID=290746 RepID=A0A914CZS6_9BILA
MIWDINQYILLSLDVLLGIIALILAVYLIVQLLRKPKPSLETEMEKGKSEEVPSEVAKPAEKSAIMEATLVESLSTDVMQTAYLPQPDVNQGTKSGGDPVPESSSSTTEENHLCDESEMDPFTQWIAFEPRQLEFNKDSNMMKKVTMQNTTKKRLAVKVLCSNNKVYRVEPICSFLDPKQSLEVEVHRIDDGSPPKEEMLVFAYIEVATTDTNIRELLKNLKKTKKIEFKLKVA